MFGEVRSFGAVAVCVVSSLYQGPDPNNGLSRYGWAANGVTLTDQSITSSPAHCACQWILHLSVTSSFFLEELTRRTRRVEDHMHSESCNPQCALLPRPTRSVKKESGTPRLSILPLLLLLLKWPSTNFNNYHQAHRPSLRKNPKASVKMHRLRRHDAIMMMTTTTTIGPKNLRCGHVQRRAARSERYCDGTARTKKTFPRLVKRKHNPLAGGGEKAKAGASPGAGVLSMAHRNMMEVERESAIMRYRDMKECNVRIGLGSPRSHARSGTVFRVHPSSRSLID